MNKHTGQTRQPDISIFSVFRWNKPDRRTYIAPSTTNERKKNDHGPKPRRSGNSVPRQDRAFEHARDVVAHMRQQGRTSASELARQERRRRVEEDGAQALGPPTTCPGHCSN